MKKDIHPKYQEVVFRDSASEALLIAYSTAHSKETIDIDGKTYPLVVVEVSSQSHPFYTGKTRVVDSTGRVDRFKKMSNKVKEKQSARKDVKSKEQKLEEKRSKAVKAEKETTKKKPAKKTTRKASVKKATAKKTTKKK